AFNAVHTYTAGGTYTVRLTEAESHCTNTFVHNIYVRPILAAFTPMPSAACPPPSAITYLTSADSSSTVSWMFGDSTTATGMTPTHTYTMTGIYTTTMTVTDTAGCVAPIVHSDTVYSMRIKGIANPGGCVPLTLLFADTVMTDSPLSTRPYPYAIDSVHWDFDDGTTADTPVTTHTFTAPGMYMVRCTVTTEGGCTYTDSGLVPVYAVPRPMVSLYRGDYCHPGIIIALVTDSTGSTPRMDYLWGDSASWIGWPSAAHGYSHPGTYVITMTPKNGTCVGRVIHRTVVLTDSAVTAISRTYDCADTTGAHYYFHGTPSTTFTWYTSDGDTSTASPYDHHFPHYGSYYVTLITYDSLTGCRDTLVDSILFEPLRYNFITSDSMVCAGSIVYFQVDTGSSPMFLGYNLPGRNWYIDTFFHDTSYTIRDTFTIPGLHTITMAFLNKIYCPDTIRHTVLVGSPTDSFTTSSTGGCGPYTAYFTDRSTFAPGTTRSYTMWDFGDGRPPVYSSAASVPHPYSATGTYTVTAISVDNIGCSDAYSLPVSFTIYHPTAAFNATSPVGCILTPVVFSNLSTDFTSCFWNFGDGDTTSVLAPTHTYTAPGAYTVTLIAHDAHGCNDTLHLPSSVVITKPTASFTMSDTFSICPPLPVNYRNTSVNASSYLWDLGWGVTSVVPSPYNLYLTSGNDSITLVAIDTNGCTDTAWGHLLIYGYAGAFTYGPDTGCVPVLVHFTASVHNMPNIVWDFADGTTAAAHYIDTISHWYTTPGAYIPKLILSTGTGCQNSSVGLDTIKIGAVVPGFRGIPEPVCLHGTMQFTDTSRSYFSRIVSVHWLFSNGDSATGPTASHVYDTLGTFPVHIAAADAWGCFADTVQYVNVIPLPIVRAWGDTLLCLGDTAKLSASGGVSYAWAPTASVLCATCNPAPVKPTAVTEYTVAATDTNGCTNTATATVTLRYYTVGGSWGDTAICLGGSVPLYDTGGDRVTWLPGSYLDDPHSFTPIAKPDISTRFVAITQLASCIPDTTFVMVVVHQPPVIDAGPDRTVQTGATVQLLASGKFIQQYLWAPDTMVSCDTCYNPTTTVYQRTTYTVVVTSDFGCTSMDSVTLDVYCDADQLFVPNTFTPNGDGENDVFYPRGRGVERIKLFRIFNRWGQMMWERTDFEPNDPAAAWDGRYDGDKARPDVYVYFIEATCTNGRPLFKKGDVTIVK
ncbi:MAG: PKD domain-containing protein, partial [Chitinophagia bacterium]|nr:PKD domain-containing protein [Chitinophagia bacterium]